MNDNELDFALAEMGARYTQVHVPPVLREQVRLIPLRARGKRAASFLGRRLRPMLGAARFVMAGAIVAFLGGLLLVAPDLDQQRAIAPAADREIATSDLVEVSVRLRSTSDCDAPDGDLRCSYVATSTDPRLSGVAVETGNQVWYPEDWHQYDMLVYGTYVTSISNDGGTWRSPPTYGVGWDLTRHDPPVERMPEDDFGGTLMLVGEGGYDGFIAVFRSGALPVFGEDGDFTDDVDLYGFVVEGEIPPPLDGAAIP